MRDDSRILENNSDSPSKKTLSKNWVGDPLALPGSPPSFARTPMISGPSIPLFFAASRPLTGPLARLVSLFPTRGSPRPRLVLFVVQKEALSALRVPLNERRQAMVATVYSSIASSVAGGGGSGVATVREAASVTDGDSVATDGPAARWARDEKAAVPLPEVLARLNPDAHPEVIAGRLDPQQVLSGVVRCGLQGSARLRSPVSYFLLVWSCSGK